MSKRKVKVGLCYGEIINAAEDEGWEDTWPDADSEEEYLPEHCDGSEAEALEYLFKKEGIEVVFVDPHTWEPLTAKQVEEAGYEYHATNEQYGSSQLKEVSSDAT